MKIKTEDGTIIDTDKARKSYDEKTDWDGNNLISRPTKSQWEHETLYLSAKGRYYLLHESQWQGSLPSAEFVTDEQAAQWLALNDHAVPAELAEMASE